MEGVIYRADGTTEKVAPKNGEDFKLEEVQKIVDGYIEVVYLKNNKIMVVNEEGKFTKDGNMNATMLAICEGAISRNDWIAGDALVCDSKMLK